MEAVFAYEYTPAALLRVSDEDSADFLQSQFSNDLKPFADGQCTYGLWLDVKGKVLADSWVLSEAPEQFLVLSELSPLEVIQATLDGHIIADDVELEALGPTSAISLVGVGAEALLDRLGLIVPATGCFVESDGLILLHGRRSSSPSFECVALSEAAMVRFREQLSGSEIGFVSKERIQRERIAAGVPAVPVEIGPADLPGEGGFEVDAISFTKGCYLGQEVVARMHNVGQARRGLFRVSGDGELPTCPSELLQADGKSAGELRTAVPVHEGWQGVALLKLRSVDEPALYIVEELEVRVDGPLRGEN